MESFTPPSPEELNLLFPAHDIQSFIAQGGMGAVYLANQISLDRPVAIKILPKEFGNDPNYRHSFETEAKAMARLNHINLVGVYDFGEIDNMLYIIMEYVPGRSLHEVAHNKTVDQIEAAKLIRDMCLGLDHAHSAGVIHRDIKPANVLIDDEAQPKIVDFGLARPLDQSDTSGVIFGTPGYTAPEVISHPLAVDQRSDIFSIGVMLHELLTGKLPGDNPIPPSSLDNGDKRFDEILENAIHPDPSIRYRTAGEMAEALDKIINEKITANTPQLKTSPRIITGATATRPASSIALGSSAITSRPLTPLASKKSSNPAVAVIAALLLITAIISFAAFNREKPTPQTTINTITKTQPKSPKPHKITQLNTNKIDQQKAHQRKAAARKQAKQEEAKRKRAEQRKLADSTPEHPLQESTPITTHDNDTELPKTDPVTTPDPSPKTTFNHIDYIENLRAQIARYASENILSYDEELEKNADSFIRKTKRALRKLDNDKRDKAEPELEAIFMEVVSTKRIPEKTPSGGDLIKEVHAEYLFEQEEIDQEHAHLLKLWSGKYISPCQLELEKLDEKQDKEAFTFLTEEIKKAESQTLHILSIARGQNILVTKNP